MPPSPLISEPKEGRSDRSSSSSSGSTTSSSSPSPTSRTSDKGRPGVKAHEKHFGRGYSWGLHLLTPVGPDASNPVPGHNAEHACTKKRSCKFAGNLETQRFLKYWVSLGTTVGSAKDHLALWSSQVEPRIKSNSVPSNETLDASL